MRACGVLDSHHHRGDEMQGHPHQPADDRAVDADELEVAAYRVFDAARDGGGVPALHRF